MTFHGELKIGRDLIMLKQVLLNNYVIELCECHFLYGLVSVATDLNLTDCSFWVLWIEEGQTLKWFTISSQNFVHCDLDSKPRKFG
jgi:hypothetical protein